MEYPYGLIAEPILQIMHHESADQSTGHEGTGKIQRHVVCKR